MPRIEDIFKEGWDDPFPNIDDGILNDIYRIEDVIVCEEFLMELYTMGKAIKQL